MELCSSHVRGRSCHRLFAICSTVLVIIWCPNIRVLAAGGDLDPSFGIGGRVTTGPGASAGSLGIQADGKYVVVGSAGGVGFGAARYNVDGSLDPNFGSGGLVTINFSGTGSQDGAFSVAIQPDGKIVIGGYTTFGIFRFALMRLNTDGTLDSTFGVGGKVSTDSSPFDSQIRAISLQPDGKIVAAGYQEPRSQKNRSDFAMARYNSDGSLDTTFGSGGRVTTDFLGFDDAANALAIQPDGKIIAVGFDSVVPVAFAAFDFALARYNSDGTLDSSFGSGGKVTTQFQGGYDEARAIALQPDGKLVVAGAATTLFIGIDFGLVRYNSDGSLDAQFGTNGKVMSDFGSESDLASTLALQPDGKIVVAGRADDANENSDFALARYNATGTLDATFGTGGKLRTDFFGFDDGVTSVALQSDGKIVAAGFANQIVQNHIQGYIALARYDGVSFDVCLQDDSSRNFLQLNSTTGDYLFTNCSGITFGGTGVIARKGANITLQQDGPDHRLLARIDGSLNRGTASGQVLRSGITFTIIDRNILNNACSCGAR